MKIIAWDLECTGLNADFGFLLCMGYKTVGDKQTHLLKISDYPGWEKDTTDDKALVKACADVLADADAWVTWYGARFDVPFLNSRLLVHGLKPLPNIPHIDGWRVAKYKLKLHSNRLASVSAFLGLDDKTPVVGPAWIKAIAGDKTSLNYIYAHCKTDVEVLEQAYQRLKPLVKDHPNHRLLQGADECCPVCGAVGKLQRRGEQVSRSRVYQRYQCRTCGAWSKSAKSIRSGLVVAAA